MEFSRRGPATDDVDDSHRFPDPPPHGEPMLVMRDALLSQLQKDRLRQEIIVGELAKIERAMALRAVSGQQATSMPRHGMAAADAERAKPSPFSAEQLMPPRRGPVGWEHYAGAGEEHDVKLPNDDGRQRSAELMSGKPVMEDHADGCLKPCEGKAGQQNAAAFDAQKLPGSNETVPPSKPSPAVKWKLTGITIPVKKPKPAMKWSCDVCQVQATSEHSFQEHCAGQKHQSNVATLESRTKAIGGQKAKAAPEPSTDQNIGAACKEGDNNDMPKKTAPQEAKSHGSDVPQHAEKSPSVWNCSICQAICTCESDLKIHLKGKRHLAIAKVRASKNMTRIFSESQKAKLNPSNMPQHAEKTNSRWICSVCHAHCTCESDFESHLGGRRHQLNIQAALHEKINQQKNNPPQIAKDQKPPSEWNCSMCQAKSNSESQFEDHCRSRRHQQKIKAILVEGKNAKASSLKNASSEKQTTLYFCEVCDLQCNSEKMLAEHRSGKKHSEKMEEQKALNFCEVCNLQCNSGKMLAHHRAGKKHRAKVNAKK